MADPVPAPTVDLDTGNDTRPDWIDSLGATLRRQRDEARAELSVLRAREAQVREVVRLGRHNCERWEDPLPVPRWVIDLEAVLDGTTESGKTG